MTTEIHLGSDSPTGANFHVYVDGAYHCSCVSLEEAEAVIKDRFQAATYLGVQAA